MLFKFIINCDVMTKYLVSIIICTLNRLDDLKETIFSLEKQTLLPFELIIVDQSDSCEIKSWFNSIKLPFNKKYIFQKEKSLTIAKNKGVLNSKGHLITFLDDDVTLDKNYIKNTIVFFNNYPNALGVTGETKVKFNENKIKKSILYFYDILFF